MDDNTLEFAYALRDLANGYIAATKDAAYWRHEAEQWKAKYDALLDESLGFPNEIMAGVMVSLLAQEYTDGR
jgi:hypothetical protein